MTDPGQVPVRFWRSGKQFLLTPDNTVWEKEHGMCYSWDQWRGQYGRDDTVPAVRWVDLVKDRAPVVTISHVEALLILMMKRVEEVAKNAQAGQELAAEIAVSWGYPITMGPGI